MPVEDHPVHASTIIGEQYRYGCHNRARPAPGAGYYAPARIPLGDAGRFAVGCRFIENVMSRECRYDMSLTDAACAGCRHRGSGEAYDATIRRSGA